MNNIGPNFKITKKQFRLIIATSILTFITLGIIIYENVKKYDHKYSYILLGIVFILMGTNNVFYYKGNGAKKFLIYSAIYFVAGIVALCFGLYKLFV